MPNKIEIFENTLLKLLVRRGLDSDRKQIVLTEGELGYTTDTKRLFIGDSTTTGGKVVGNVFKGSATSVTSLAPAEIGDLAYDSDDRVLYRLQSGTGSNLSDWEKIGGVYTGGNNTISINSSNGISVNLLSAGNFDKDAVGNSIEISSGKISLSSFVNVDGITLRDTSASNYLKLPSRISASNINYTLPSTNPNNGQFLGFTGVDTNLAWLTPSVATAVVSPTTATAIPVGTIVPFASSYSVVPYGWIPCDGRLVSGSTYPELSAVIGVQYGGSGNDFNVPDLTNRTLYGNTNSVTSTTYQLASSTSFALSATGMAYMIKAISGVTTPSLTVFKPLSVTRNGVDITGTAFNPLSGNIILKYSPTVVLFNQAGTINAGNNVTSVVLGTAANLAGTGRSYSGINPGGQSYVSSGKSGVYLINLTTAVSDVNKTVVSIQALNFRQGNNPVGKSMQNALPLYDYVWLSSTQLAIGIVTTQYENYNENSVGSLVYQWLDSGAVSSTTRFKVEIIEL